MPDTTTDHGVDASTVQVLTEEPITLPSEQQLADAKASAMLGGLFVAYKKLKRSRPKFPGESAVMQLIPRGDAGMDEINTLVIAATDKFGVWVNECVALLGTISQLGEDNPGAAVHIVGKDGRSIQMNGNKLYEALLRTEAQILGGSLA